MKIAFGLLILIAVIGHEAESHKVLFLPFSIKSHIIMHAGIAKALIKQGHQAYILKHQSTATPSQLVNSGIKFMTYRGANDTHFMDSQEFQTGIQRLGKNGFLKELPTIYKVLAGECTDYLDNEPLFHKLANEKFDFVVVDNIFALQCRFAVPHRLGVPYANLMVLPPIDLFSLTLQNTFITPIMPFFYSERMSFLNRLGHFILINAITTVSDFIQPMELIHKYTKDRPVSGLRELKENVALWFVDEDPVLGYTRQLPPNVLYLGSVSAGPAQKLPDDIAKFADSAKNGLIVISYGGSLITDFPEEEINRLFKGIGITKYKAIIRLKKKDFKVGSNIKIVDWLPQNDLLAHPNAKIFITHSGKGSINEAIYHGVPMICVPTQGEQSANAQRVQDRGWGITMDRATFTSLQMAQTIEIVSNQTYKTQVKKASAIVRNRKLSGADEAVFWIDHVIKYGDKHLKPYSMQYSWYQILMLDIIATLLLAFLAMVYCVKKSIGLCCRCCKTKKSKKKEKKN